MRPRLTAMLFLPSPRWMLCRNPSERDNVQPSGSALMPSFDRINRMNRIRSQRCFGFLILSILLILSEFFFEFGVSMPHSGMLMISTKQ